jgi:hypothetical protein
MDPDRTPSRGDHGQPAEVFANRDIWARAAVFGQLSTACGSGDEMWAEAQQLRYPLDRSGGVEEHGPGCWVVDLGLHVGPGERQALDSGEIVKLQAGRGDLFREVAGTVGVADESVGDHRRQLAGAFNTGEQCQELGMVLIEAFLQNTIQAWAHREIAATKTGLPARTTRPASRNVWIRSWRSGR